MFGILARHIYKNIYSQEGFRSLSCGSLWFLMARYRQQHHAIAICQTSQAAAASKIFVFAEALREWNVSARNSILLRRGIGIVDVNVLCHSQSWEQVRNRFPVHLSGKVTIRPSALRSMLEEHIGDFSPTGRNNAHQSSVLPARELTQTTPRMCFKMARSCVFGPSNGQAGRTQSIGVGTDAKDRKREQRGYIGS
jgi:hypothetical protein